MKAIIYCAGRAVRLGAKHAHRPKILLEFGGCTLLEWHAVRLVESGVRDLTLVVGYRGDQIESALPGLGRRHGLQVKSIRNEDYTEGSVLSFHVSLPELECCTEPVLLMDGDVLYPAALLRRLVLSTHPTALLIDRNYSTADDDPVLVPMRGGRPFDFRKQWTGSAEQVGESIGFFKVAPADLPLLRTATLKRATGLARMDSYDDVLREMVQADRFGCEDVTGLPWTEIDFPDDIVRAEQEVLPAILRLSP